MAKKYIDENREYLFNPEALNEEIKKQASKRVEKNGKSVKVTTQSEIMDNIADATCVTKEAVNNWKLNRNGPRDIDTIKDIATVLNVDYKSFLIPLDNQESNMENEIINETYKKCIEMLYKYSKEKECINCEELHKYIDQNTLSISGITKYKLHRIVIEFEKSLNNTLCERWYEFDEDTWYGYHSYIYTDDRNSLIEDDWTFEEYIGYEIELAEKLGYLENDPIPKDIDATQIPIENRKEYGADTYEDYQITPKAIYIDIVTELLSRVFKHDFC